MDVGCRGCPFLVLSTMQSVLRKSFLEYVSSEPEEIRLCLHIKSVFKNPRFNYTVYHNTKTDQLICEGDLQVNEDDESVDETFRIFEDAADTYTSKFLLHLFPVATRHDELSMHGYGDNNTAFLNKLITEWKGETVWSHN